jgi:peroxiredoxin
MSAINSTMLPLGTPAPDFSLPDICGKTVSPADFRGKRALLLAVICNHCPYVKHVIDVFSKLAAEYQKKDVGVIAISSNDSEAYPEDALDLMAEFAAAHGFTFPYVYDESQETAIALHAACTPDFFLFDKDGRLVYRGRMDDASPGNDRPVTGRDLRAALDTLLEGRSLTGDQKPSLGCSLKWKPGREPAYMSA